MNDKIILSKLNRREALRYLGYKSTDVDENIKNIMDICEKKVLSAAKPRFTYKVFNIEITGGGVHCIGTDLVLKGNSILEHLKGCEMAVLMAVTISSDIDRLIRIAHLEDIAHALIIDSMSSVAVEQAGDRAEEIIDSEFSEYYKTFRFSPGYGDMPIQQQPEFIKQLNADKLIGLTVNADSFMLMPTKSVTAVIGLSKNKIDAKSKGCITCSMYKTCKFREEGGRCNG